MRTFEEILGLIKEHKKLPDWVAKARDNHKVLKALVYGEDFKEVLIERIEQIEDRDRSKARLKYSIDIRDLFARVLEPRQNVFFADGADEYYDNEAPDANVTALQEALQSFKAQASIDEYISTNLFRFSDIDPNGLIFMELKAENGTVKTYPTYKSINTISGYESDGILLKWVLFKTDEIIPKTGLIHKWRYVDETINITIIETGGGNFVVQDEFANPFEQVPAVVLSTVQKVGSEIRLSWIYFIEELAKKYARDRSVKTIYEFLQGFPKHWRYAMICSSCKGSGQVEGKVCRKCNGKGVMTSADVTDDIILPLPNDKDYDIVVAPNVAGFISPDLATLKHMAESENGLEHLIMYTMWGVEKERSGGNETATGRFIDTQPLINKLHTFADFAELVHNKLARFTTKVVTLRDDVIYKKTYGRRFIIESPDVLLEKYGKAKSTGASTLMLDKLHSEYISSKYKNDPELRVKMMKKAAVEPYLHLTIEQVKAVFGDGEALKKYLFSQFWRDADKQKTVDELIQDFNQWLLENIENEDDELKNVEALKSAQINLKGTVGGLNGIIDINTAVSSGQMDRDSAVSTLIVYYGYSREDAELIITKTVISNTNINE